MSANADRIGFASSSGFQSGVTLRIGMPFAAECAAEVTMSPTFAPSMALAVEARTTPESASFGVDKFTPPRYPLGTLSVVGGTPTDVICPFFELEAPAASEVIAGPGGPPELATADW